MPTRPCEVGRSFLGEWLVRHNAPDAPRVSISARSRQPVFQLVSSRYERASLIVTSDKPFGRSQPVVM